jgi:hypothetical protein
LTSNHKYMSKKRKKKKAKYPHLIPNDYLLGIADRLHGMNPTLQIVLNTITDVWRHGYGKGYIRRQEETVRFRQKQEQHLESEFKQWQTYLDDKIHDKEGIVLSFEDWLIKQKQLKKSNNENNKK